MESHVYLCPMKTKHLKIVGFGILQFLIFGIVTNVAFNSRGAIEMKEASILIPG